MNKCGSVCKGMFLYSYCWGCLTTVASEKSGFLLTDLFIITVFPYCVYFVFSMMLKKQGCLHFSISNIERTQLTVSFLTHVVNQGWGPMRSLFPQEDLCALQVCAGGACRAFSSRPAGKDDDEAGIRLSETLHLWWRLGLRLGGVRMGPTWDQARTGTVTEQNGTDAKSGHKLTQCTCSLKHAPAKTQTIYKPSEKTFDRFELTVIDKIAL